MKMMVKFLSGTVAGGKQVKAGQIMELPKNEALYLIRLKKADTHTPSDNQEESPSSTVRKRRGK